MTAFPRFYNPGRIGTLFYPDVGRIAEEAKAAGLAPASEDRRRVHFLIVDMQVDFCHPRGTLFVPGALEDIRRVIEFIYTHAERLTSISCSLDSHYPLQIFHAAWWADGDGNPPEPFTVITRQAVEQGKWRPLFEPEWSVSYVEALQAKSKKELVIWPYHVPVGGVGNSLDPELWSALFWHSIARKAQPTWWIKGGIPGSEHYSVIQPEIDVPDHPQGRRNEALLRAVEEYDEFLVAGEASSHCVLETLADLVEEFRSRPEVLSKIFVLEDCTSPVEHPRIDFATIARKKFGEFRKAGVQFVKSTEVKF